MAEDDAYLFSLDISWRLPLVEIVDQTPVAVPCPERRTDVKQYQQQNMDDLQAVSTIVTFALKLGVRTPAQAPSAARRNFESCGHVEFLSPPPPRGEAAPPGRIRPLIAGRRHAMTRFPSAVVVPIAALALAACSSDSTAPESSPIAGNYTATQLSITEGGFSADALGLGVSLTMTLTSPSAVSGALIVPAAISESGSIEVNDLVGTFTQRADTVRFTETADTFVRDIPFLVRGNTLTATNARAGTATYTVVLTRQ